MWRGAWIDGADNVTPLLNEAPIEVRAAFEMAIERGDFVRATDVLKHEWRQPK